MKKRTHYDPFSQLSQTNEERAVRASSHSNQRGFVSKLRSQSIRPPETPNYGDGLGVSTIDQLDYSYQQERAQKQKMRWMRVIENKEQLKLKKQMELKSRMDKMSKKAKEKELKSDDNKEDKKALQELREQKQKQIMQRRQQLEIQYQKELEQKEIQLMKRLQEIEDLKKRGQLSQINNSHMMNQSANMSEIEESQQVHPNTHHKNGTQRAQTAQRPHKQRKPLYYQSEEYESEDEDEKLARQLNAIDEKFRRAEHIKYIKQQEKLGKSENSDERLKMKLMMKEQKKQAIEFERLRYIVEKKMSKEKKSQKTQEEMKYQKEAMKEHLNNQEEVKRTRLNELRKLENQKIANLEQKLHQKEQVSSNIRNAMEEFTYQKRELKMLKKQEQEINLKKHKRVQSAYKRILIEKVMEKNMRAKELQERKEMIQKMQLKNSVSLRHQPYQQASTTNNFHTVQKDRMMHSSSANHDLVGRDD